MDKQLPIRAVLRNGECVLVREIGPEDRELMREGFDSLSSQSRFFRFLAPHLALSEAELDQFTEENTDDHFAIGAASVGVEMDMPLGTARFVRVAKDSSEAEIALTIIDSHQRLGLGSLLLRTLARAAHSRGITSFVAMTHRENTGMQGLLRCHGGVQITSGAEGEWRVPLPLKAQAVPHRANAEIAIIQKPAT